MLYIIVLPYFEVILSFHMFTFVFLLLPVGGNYVQVLPRMCRDFAVFNVTLGRVNVTLGQRNKIRSLSALPILDIDVFLVQQKMNR